VSAVKGNIQTMHTSKSLSIQVRNGLFLASSRTYGEQYLEPFVRAKYGLLEPETGDHDAIGSDGHQYEIKACKVLRASENGKAKPLLDRILYENRNLETNRLIPFSEHKSAEYLANVQNVKRDHFDTLIYVLLFEDCAKIFFAKKEEISKGIFASWSDKHGRYDEFGKSGQFGITRTTIEFHIENHLVDMVSYEEMTEIFQGLSL
jgi:hypothetical protein